MHGRFYWQTRKNTVRYVGIGAVALALVIGATQIPGGASPAVANLWVNTTAGASPSRCATACVYNSTHAYGSLTAAFTAASPGDHVLVKCGSYGNQTFTTSQSTTPVTISSETGVCATVNELDFNDTDGAYLTADHLTLPQGAGGTTVDHLKITNSMIGVGQWTSGPILSFHALYNSTIQGNTIGPACCGNSPAFGSPHSSPEGIRIGNAGETNSTGDVIDSNLIQGVVRLCANWMSGYGACPDSDCPSFCHADGIHLWGIQNSVISDNSLVQDAVQGIFIENSNGSVTGNNTVINNQISLVENECGICSGADGGGTTIGSTLIAFNTTPDVITLSSTGANEAAGASYTLVGNIGKLLIASASTGNNVGCTGINDANLTVNYSYNVWIPVGGGTPGPCGTGDVYPASPQFVSPTDLDLDGAAQAADNLVPHATCTPITTRDIHGNSRPHGVDCDAGADER